MRQARPPVSFDRPTPASRARSEAQSILDDTRRRALNIAGPTGLLPVLRRAEASLKQRREAMAIDGASPAEAAHVEAMLAQVRDVLGRTGPEMLHLLASNARACAKLGVKSTVDLLGLLEGRHPGAVRPLAVVEAAAASRTVLERHAASVDRYGSYVIGRFRDVMQHGLLIGETFGEMTERIEKAGGAFLPARWMAERIVRTEGMSALNAGAHGQMLEQRAEHLHDLKKKIIATFDRRTAQDSVGVHGEVRELEEMFVDGAGRQYLLPPARPNDREVVIPWRDAWKEPDRDEHEAPEATEPPPGTAADPGPAATPPEPPRPEPPPVLTLSVPLPALVASPPAVATPAPAPPAAPPPEGEPAGPRVVSPKACLPALRNAMRRTEGDDASEAREVVKGLLRHRGLTDFNERYGRPDRASFRILSGEQANAELGPGDAAHQWSGEVVMRKSSWLAAKRGALALRGATPEAVQAAARGLGARELHNLTVLVHEELHGHSPLHPSAYVGHGLGIEEAVTESLARVTMRRVVGLERSDRTPGFALPRWDPPAGAFTMPERNSYDPFILDLYGSAHHVAGGKPEKLPALVEGAMHKLRSGGYADIRTPEAHFEAFADALGHPGKGAELLAEFDRRQRARAGAP